MKEEILFLKEEIICKDCSNVKHPWPNNACKIYPMWKAQHTRIGGCAADSRKEKSKNKEEFKLNPMKASKRGEVK